MSLSAGKDLGPYRILEKIGEGGMGSVYRALDTRLKREVAVKALPESLTKDPERVARFKREARLLAALNHPGVGAIYDMEHEGETPYLVLELVDGQSLESLLQSGPLTLPRARLLFLQASEALEVAHQSHILHRDLKPGNIMVAAQDRVKLLDFGLAKELPGALAGEADLATQEGALLSTAFYLPPEQLQARPLDVRSDVWSLGCCLYEATTGQKAFEEANLGATLNAILQRDPDWSLVPDHEGLLALLKDCLNKDPARRPASMDEFRRRLDARRGPPSRPIPPR